MDAPREIELKLECDEADLAAVARHPLLQAADAGIERLETRYLDTAQRSLREAGLTLRLRDDGEHTIQTLKAISAGSVGLFDRAEWAWRIAGLEVDVTLLETTPAAAVLAEARAPELGPLFVSRVERSRRQISYGASRIVATLDRGCVEAEAGRAPLHELELELAEGQPVDLFAIAAALGQQAPVRLGVLSKADRGFALIDGQLDKPSKSSALALDPGIRAGEAFALIVKACLRHLRLNEDVFRRRRAPEALHQMRVALRRLRSAFTLFKPMLARDDRALALRESIKTITEPFGTARNLDVFIGETLSGEIERRPDQAGLRDLQHSLNAERDAAYTAVLCVLAGPAWRALLIDLVRWIDTEDWQNGVNAERDRLARDFASDVLERLRRRLKRRGRDVAGLDPEQRHEVRIVAKKLRYGSEFFGSLFPDKKARKRQRAFVAALSDLQDHLGTLNDLTTAHQIADRLVATKDDTAKDGATKKDASGKVVSGAAVFAAGLALADAEAEARAARLVARADAARESLIGIKPFWR